jgi:erythromycin esterase-like protein
VDALAADDAWAVGSYTESGIVLTLIEHWDGTSWSVVPSPSPGLTQNDLTSVSAVAPGRAWAVGGYLAYEGHRREIRTLIARWDGHAWTQVASPNPGVKSNVLTGVAATSAADAWAVGSYTPEFHSGRRATLVLHWDGASWSQVESPNPGGRQDEFTAVAATSSRHAWAVGDYRGEGKGRQTLIARWSGAAWKQVWSPNPGPTENHLYAVSIASPKDVWAVGEYVPTRGTGGAPHRTLFAHFGAGGWTQVRAPHPAGWLVSVSADSSSDAWAVGLGELFLRWNGSHWSNIKRPGYRLPRGKSR